MSTAAFRRRFHLGLVAVLLAALVWAVALADPTSASAATRTPPVPAGLPAAIEPLSGYVPATSCGTTAQPGTVALARLLTSTYPGTSYGITRACGADPLPTSEHYDGRAVDWMNSARSTEQAARAKAFIGWLSASDAAGNRYANARRLGVMYVIWDGKIWGAYSADRGWRPYSTCADRPERSWDSTCHRDHVHVSLSWAGARGATSFWSKQVPATDYGPCRTADLNWAAPTRYARAQPCPRHPRVSAASGASATQRTLVTFSGMRLVRGSSGPVVKAVQTVLGVDRTGYYGPKTQAAVKRFQTAQDLTASGNVNTATWRALLGRYAPGRA